MSKITDHNSLLQFIFNQMEKLESKEIDQSQAHAMAKLAREANNTLNYGAKRAEIILNAKRLGVELDELKEIPKAIEKSNEEIKVIKRDSNPYSAINDINYENRNKD